MLPLEEIQDVLTAGFVILIISIVVAAAWVSTHVREQQLVATAVVVFRQRNISNSTTTAQQRPQDQQQQQSTNNLATPNPQVTTPNSSASSTVGQSNNLDADTTSSSPPVLVKVDATMPEVSVENVSTNTSSVVMEPPFDDHTTDGHRNKDLSVTNTPPDGCSLNLNNEIIAGESANSNTLVSDSHVNNCERTLCNNVSETGAVSVESSLDRPNSASDVTLTSRDTNDHTKLDNELRHRNVGPGTSNFSLQQNSINMLNNNNHKSVTSSEQSSQDTEKVAALSSEESGSMLTETTPQSVAEIQDTPETASINFTSASTTPSVVEKKDTVSTSVASVSQDHVPPPPGCFRIRLKFLDETQRTVHGKMNDLVINFKRAHFATEIGENRMVRLIFNGHLLSQDSNTLGRCGLFDNCVVHCHISQPRPTSTTDVRNGPSTVTSNIDEDELDLSELLVPLLFGVLLVLWYLRYEYSHLFNTSTTVIMVFLTALLLISQYALTITLNISLGGMNNNNNNSTNNSLNFTASFGNAESNTETAPAITATQSSTSSLQEEPTIEDPSSVVTSNEQDISNSTTSTSISPLSEIPVTST